MTDLIKHIPAIAALALTLFAGGVCLGAGIEVGKRLVKAVATLRRFGGPTILYDGYKPHVAGSSVTPQGCGRSGGGGVK